MNDRNPTDSDERQVQNDQPNRESESARGTARDELERQGQPPSQSGYRDSGRQSAPAGSQPPAQQGYQQQQGQTSFRGGASVQAGGRPDGQMQHRMETERGQSPQGGQFDGSSGTAPMQQGEWTFEQAMMMPFEQTVQFQRTAAQLFLNGLQLQDSVQRRWTEMTRSLFHNYLDTVDRVSRDTEQGVHRQVQTTQQFQPDQQMRGSYEVQGRQGQASQSGREAQHGRSGQWGPEPQQGQYAQWEQQGRYGQREQTSRQEQMSPQGREMEPRREAQSGRQDQYDQRTRREHEGRADRRSEPNQQTGVEARGEFEVGESDAGEGAEETEHEERDEQDEDEDEE